MDKSGKQIASEAEDVGNWAHGSDLCSAMLAPGSYKGYLRAGQPGTLALRHAQHGRYDKRHLCDAQLRCFPMSPASSNIDT